ncbi:MAG: hypothetical protein ACYDHF_08915 [Candidatus Cryosericum sp.]
MPDAAHTNTLEYLFCVTEKGVKTTLYDLGTLYDCVDAGNASLVLRNRHSQQEKVVPAGACDFLLDAEFVGAADHRLTSEGREVFELLYIHQDTQQADEYLRRALLRNPVVNLVGQVFYGRGRQSVEQLRTLLNYHKIADREIEYGEVISLLTLLNGFDIIVYDKKNRQFYVREAASGEVPISQYYINPSTPFSNIYNLRRVIRTCQGSVFWIDKHFRKEGFEILLDGLPFEGVSSVVIISGTDNVTQSAKTDYCALRAELAARSTTLSWRIVTDSGFKWHDRWLLADNQCHNIPPILAVIKGQRAEILQTKSRLDPQPFMDVSVPVEET